MDFTDEMEYLPVIYIPTGQIEIPFTGSNERNRDKFQELMKWAAKYGELGTFENLLSDSKLDPSVDNNALIILASKNGNLDIVELLLDDKRVDPSANNNEALKKALKGEHFDVARALLAHPNVDALDIDDSLLLDYIELNYPDGVRFLLEEVGLDPTYDDNMPIKIAAQGNHLEILNILLEYPEVDPSIDNNYPIIAAAEFGNIEIIRRLIQDPRVDPSAQNNRALRKAVKYEQLDSVRELLKNNQVDPSVNDNYPLRQALTEGYIDITEDLLRDARIKTLSDSNQEEFLMKLAKSDHPYVKNQETYSDLFKLLLYSSKLTPSENIFYKIITGGQTRNYSNSQKETIKYASQLQDAGIFEETFLDGVLIDTLGKTKELSSRIRPRVFIPNQVSKLYYLVKNGAIIDPDYHGSGSSLNELIQDKYIWSPPTMQFLFYYFVDIAKDFEDLEAWEKQTETMLSLMDNISSDVQFLKYFTPKRLDKKSKLAAEKFFVDNYTYWFQDLFKKNARNNEFIDKILESKKSLNYIGELDGNSIPEFSKIVKENDLQRTSLLYLLKLIVEERFYLAGLLKVFQVDDNVEKLLVKDLIEKHRKFCQLKIINLSDYERRDMVAQLLKNNIKLFKKDQYEDLLRDFSFTCKLLAISMVCADLRKNLSLREISDIYSELFGTKAEFTSKEEMCDSLKNKLFRAEIEKESLKRKKEITEGTRKKQRVK